MQPLSLSSIDYKDLSMFKEKLIKEGLFGLENLKITERISQ